MKDNMKATSGFLKGLNPTVAIVSKTIIIVFVLYGTLMTESASEVFNAIKNFIIDTLKWYYIGIVAFFLFFVIWLLLSRYGNIRLGKDDEKPEFSRFSWFAMLFGAGMGIGLVFWSIAEPVYHFYSNPFVTEGMTPQAAQVAMRITFFHWGLHPWAIYVIVGLTLSYFAYRKGLPLTIRSALYPIIGDKIYGPIGHTVDILAIFGTVFGAATSLGLGVQQIDAGLAYLFGYQSHAANVAAAKALCATQGITHCSTPFPTNVMLLIGVITSIAVASVVSGVGKGIKILSELNLWLSIIILAFFLAFGPTDYLLSLFLQSTGDYIAKVIPLSLWTDANQNRAWQANWTVFYWGWWIAWAPFVGMFIARISRGRTIREFILGVLFVPTLLTFFWLTLFGGTALHTELFHEIEKAGETVLTVGQAGIVEAVVIKNNVTMALYTTFETMNIGIIGTAAAALTTLLIATYFITSSDSATLVVNTIMSLGDENPPISHRIMWGVSEGIVAGVLLIAGGLKALQTASIVAALPFSIVILFMIYGLTKALRQEIVYIGR